MCCNVILPVNITDNKILIDSEMFGCYSNVSRDYEEWESLLFTKMKGERLWVLYEEVLYQPLST